MSTPRAKLGVNYGLWVRITGQCAFSSRSNYLLGLLAMADAVPGEGWAEAVLDFLYLSLNFL